MPGLGGVGCPGSEDAGRPVSEDAECPGLGDAGFPGSEECWVRGSGMLGSRSAGWGGRPARFGSSSLGPELGGAGDHDGGGGGVVPQPPAGTRCRGEQRRARVAPGTLQRPSGRAVSPELDPAPREGQRWGRGVPPGVAV